MMSLPPVSTIIGKRRYRRTHDYQTMVDSSVLWKTQDLVSLRKQLDVDGYVLLREIIAPEKVLAARRMVLEHLVTQEAIVGPEIMDAHIAHNEDGTYVKGWTVDAESGGVVGDRDENHEAWAAIGNSDTLTQVYNGPDLHALYRGLFGDTYRPQPGCTWMRIRGHGDVTVEHADYYYFKQHTDLFHGQYRTHGHDPPPALPAMNTQCTLCDRLYDGSAPPVSQGEWHCDTCADASMEVYTCWIALGDISYANGTLWMRPGTHRLTGFAQSTTTEVPLSSLRSKWESTEFHPGDIVLFAIKTLHAASKNTTDTFRLSLDTRVVGRPWYHQPPLLPSPSPSAASMADRCFYMCLATIPHLPTEERISVLFLLANQIAHHGTTAPCWWKAQVHRLIDTISNSGGDSNSMIQNNLGLWTQALKWAHYPHVPSMNTLPHTWRGRTKRSWHRSIADLLSAAYSNGDDRHRITIVSQAWEWLDAHMETMSTPLYWNSMQQLCERDTNRIYFLTHVILLDTSWGLHAPTVLNTYWFHLLWQWFSTLSTLDSPAGYIREVWIEVAICMLLLYDSYRHRHHPMIEACTALHTRLIQCNASPLCLRRTQGIYHTDVEAGRDPWIVHYHLAALVLLFQHLFQRFQKGVFFPWT
jgi:Phytanoyl-CoA dioxygenase (PhyH)